MRSVSLTVPGEDALPPSCPHTERRNQTNWSPLGFPGAWAGVLELGRGGGCGAGPTPGRGCGSCGLAWSSGFLMGRRAGQRLCPVQGPAWQPRTVTGLGRCWQSRAGSTGTRARGPRAGVVPKLDALPTGDGALPGKRTE